MDENSFNEIMSTIKEYEASVNLNNEEAITAHNWCRWEIIKNRSDFWDELNDYSNKCLEYLRFGHSVDEVTSGNYHFVNAVKVLDSTPKLLQKMSFSDYPVLYSQRHIIDALKPKENDYPSYHGFSVEEIKRLPELLDEKIAICADNPSRSDSMLLILEAVDSDNLPLISSIKPDGKGNYEFEEIKTNFILTVFGKDNFEQYFDKVVGEDRILYFDEQKVKNLEALAERQLFSCHPKIVNEIIRYPECLVNFRYKQNQTYLKTPDGKEKIAVSDEVMFDALERKREQRIESKRQFINDPSENTDELLPEKKNNPRERNIELEDLEEDILVDCPCINLDNVKPNFTSKEAELEFRRSIMRSQVLPPNQSIAEAKQISTEFNKGLSDTKRHVMNQSSRKR